MTEIIEIESYLCELPRRREWTQHGIAQTLDRRVVLKVTCDDGRFGWGEATALPQWGGLGGRYYGETRETVSTIIHDILAHKVAGADPLQLPAVLQAFDESIRGHPYAKATVEMALQDLRGKLLGTPIYQLLGGAVRDSIRIAHMLTMMPNTDALAEARAAQELDGVTAFQIKGGIDIRRDVDLIVALRRECGSEVALRLDANRGYGRSRLDVADACRQLEAAGVDAIEQPADSLDAMAAAQSAVSIPVVADESCWTAGDVLDLWRAGAAGAVSVYVAKAGGIGAAADVARLANVVGLPCDLNGSLESGIGSAASIHVALSSIGATNPSIIPVPSVIEEPLTQLAGRYWTDGIVSSGFSWSDGYLSVSDAPGLGIEVDEEKLNYYAGSSRRRVEFV